MNWNKTAKWLRLLVITGLLAWVTYESYLHQVLGGGKAPSVHALCPFGALESLYTLLFLGTYVQKIYSGTVVLLGLTVVITILFRRSFCGLLCPFGALQELFGLLGQKIFKKRLVVPLKLDRPLRYLKYAALALTLVMAWYYGKLWMAPYDPYSAYSHITTISASIAEDPLAVIGFALLAVTLLGSVLYDRFFCKYLCPMGIFYGIIGKISPTIVERNDGLCIHCKSCSKVCPVNIDVEKAVRVTSIECINCNECVLVCPKKGALEVKTAQKVVQPLAMLLVVVGLFFGTILVAQATGNYQIMPSALKEGEIISITEVKGYYTIEDAAIATGLSLEEVYEKLGIPKNVPKSTTLKEISNVAPGYDFDAAKAQAGGEDATATETDTGTVESGKVDISGIKGSMTIREAADSLQMDLQEFYALFQIPADVPAQTKMKDIGTVSPGYDLEKMKELLD
jgi:NAD-dependent dihydropyrimidine dehydrogenase PreA subunit